MRGKRWAVLLAPVLLAGCGGFTETPGATVDSAPGAVGTGSWVIVTTGSPTPSATRRSIASPSATATTGFLPLGAPRTRPTPAPTCTDIDWRIGEINGLTVVPGPRSARVSWVHAGGYDLLQYRLTAISQNPVLGTQRDVGWVTATPTTPCQVMTATITGLDRKTAYTFSLDAVFTRKAGDGTRAATVARAIVISTT